MSLEGCSCASGGPEADAGADTGNGEVEASVEAGPDVAQPDTCGNGIADELEICDPSLTDVSHPHMKCDCDDGNPLTLDRCKAGTSVEACTCECESLAADVCGNGLIGLGETCEVFIDGVTPAGTPACDCDDGNPCTLDITDSGNATTCDLVCSHPARGPNEYGVTTCNDGKSCTQDVIVGGSPATCDVVCQHNPVPGWDVATCNDGNGCTRDVVTSADLATCTAQCEHPTQTGYPYQGWGCDDGISCTTDVTGALNPNTCQYACTHTGTSGYGITDCDDGDVCTTDTISGGAPMTCNVACQHHDTRNDADVPDTDTTFDDTNCDGVDGTASAMVFVAKDGNDTSGTGSRSAPFATITRGIEFASTNTRAHVAVSLGTYQERVVLRNGVSIHGGYARNGAGANSWTRSVANTTIIAVPHTAITDGRIEAVFAESISALTQLDRFVVTAGSTGTAPSVAGTSVYGIRVVSSDAGVGGGLELHHVSVTAGRGANGSNGSPGNMGEAGNRGGDAPSRNPGGGAVQQCGTGTDVEYTRGGGGGAGGADTAAAVCWGDHDGSPGNAPPGHPGCAVGHGGDDANGCGTDRAHDGGSGSSTCTGPGSTGMPAGGVTSRGLVVSGAWAPTSGLANAARGTPGVGGSGGGGGGSGNCDTWCRGADGGGGGGGGSGGCGGYPGTAGTGGGGSFGLFLVDSDGVRIFESQFVASDGGNGGSGGAGGGGGAGGEPGNGRPGADSGSGINSRPSSDGGPGGAGRNGGQAGGAGGGSGGPSIAQFLCRSTDVVGASDASGAAGSGGNSGAGGAPNGPSGPVGVSATLHLATASCEL